MKKLLAAFFLLLFVVSCQEPTSIENSLNNISFRTDKTSYITSDNIKVVLENKSGLDIKIGLRCGIYPEMFYQKKKDNVWSDNFSFRWMLLKCPTVLNTIPSNNVFTYSIEPGMFDTTGTYRLVVDIYKKSEDIKISKFSNMFFIQE